MNSMIQMLLTLVLGLFVFFGSMVIGALLIAYPLHLAWNYVMPVLFGLPHVGVIQAFCLYFVASCLIKSSHTSK